MRIAAPVLVGLAAAAGFCAAGFCAAGFCAPASAAPAPITIATGPPWSFALPLGGAICRAVEEETDRKTRCSLVATDGSVDNLGRLRDGQVNLAIVQSDVATDALAAAGSFNGKAPFVDLRGVAGFYAEPLTILVRNDGQVTRIDDLKGKRVAVGEPNMPDSLFSAFLDALGWSKADLGGTVEMPRGDRLGALCDGTVAAVALTAPHPNGFVRAALNAKCALSVLDLGAGAGAGAIETVTATHPAYSAAIVDLGVYTGQKVQIHSFGPRAVLVTTSKLDSEMVTKVAAAIDRYGEDLRKAHPGFADLDRGAIFSPLGLGVERHEAAARYIEEHKIADPGSGE